jgi:TrmH family RNA methyltransferase
VSLTKREVTTIKSLQTKEGRKELQQFIVEGEKMVNELLSSQFDITGLYATAAYALPEGSRKVKITEVSATDLDRISALSTPNKVLATVRIPKVDAVPGGDQLIYCTGLNDPGNAGTILRIADWFGFNGVVLTNGSVDVFSPKVVQSSMGSLFRVPVFYDHNLAYLSVLASKKHHLYLADMKGEDINLVKFERPMVLIMGSESHGIPDEIKAFKSTTITIPGQRGAESLNVGVACGIIAHRVFKS